MPVEPTAVPPNGKTQSSVLTPQSLPDELSAVGGLLLIAALLLAVGIAWNNPQSSALYSLGKADSLLYAGRYSQAQSLLEHTLLTYDSAHLRLSLSYAYLARRDAGRAERQARMALSLGNGEMQSLAWAQLGRVLAFAGRNAEALDAWSQSLSTARPYMSAPAVQTAARSSTWHMAMSEWREGQWGDARSKLESLLNIEDIYANAAKVRLAQLLGPTGSEMSLQLLSEVSESQFPLDSTGMQASIPDMRLPGLSEGLSAREIARITESLRRVIQDVANAQKNGGGEAEIAALLGNAYLEQGEYALARRYLESAVTMRPDFADAHTRLALALLSQGDVPGALEHLQTSVQIDPQAPLPHHVLARLYVEQRDWSRAKAEFDLLQKLEPGSVQLHLQMADYYMQQGEYDKAEDEYKDAVSAQDSQLDDAQQSSTDAALALARFYTDVRGNGCQALPAARMSVANHPGDADSLDAIGWSLVLCNTAPDAIQPLQQAVDAAPDVPRFHYHLARAYSISGQIEEARDQYQWTIDLDPTGPWERLATAELVKLGSDE